jgi:hypothetical protein
LAVQPARAEGAEATNEQLRYFLLAERFQALAIERRCLQGANDLLRYQLCRSHRRRSVSSRLLGWIIGDEAAFL